VAPQPYRIMVKYLLILAAALGLARAAEHDMTYMQRDAAGEFQERTITLTPGTFLRIGSNGTLTAGSTADFKSAIALGNVENVALSTWAGSGNITTTGNLTSGGVPYSLLTGTVPTWNQNTSGNATNVTGVIAIAHGGTGNATASGGLSALGGQPLNTYLTGISGLYNPLNTYVGTTQGVLPYKKLGVGWQELQVAPFAATWLGMAFDVSFARTSLDLGSLATQNGTFSDKADASALSSHTGSASNPHSVTAAQVGLGSVENKALSTWAGSGNITTTGNLTSGGVPYSLLTGTVPTWNQNTTGSSGTVSSLDGHNVSELANDAGYLKPADASGLSVSVAAYADRAGSADIALSAATTGELRDTVALAASALQPADAAGLSVSYATAASTSGWADNAGVATSGWPTSLSGFNYDLDLTGESVLYASSAEWCTTAGTSSTANYANSAGVLLDSAMQVDALTRSAGTWSGDLAGLATALGVPPALTAGTDYLAPTGDGSGLSGVLTDANAFAPSNLALDGLSDVSAATPALDDRLKWNGTAWVNTPVASTVGAAVSYWFCDDVLFAGTSPVWHELETAIDSGSVGSHTATGSTYSEMDRYVTPALGITAFSAGEWRFELFGKLSTTSRVGRLQAQIYRVDASGAIVGSVLATAETGEFTNTAPSAAHIASVYLAAQTGWAATDRIGVIISGKRGSSSTTVTFEHNAATGMLSCMTTPIALLHDKLPGLHLAGSGVPYGHISDAAQTIAGDKTFTGNNTFSRVNIGTGDYGWRYNPASGGQMELVFPGGTAAFYQTGSPAAPYMYFPGTIQADMMVGEVTGQLSAPNVIVSGGLGLSIAVMDASLPVFLNDDAATTYTSSANSTITALSGSLRKFPTAGTVDGQLGTFFLKLDQKTINQDPAGLTPFQNPQWRTAVQLTADLAVGQKVAVPASISSTGRAGDYALDADYLYLCTATNTWRRTALTTW